MKKMFPFTALIFLLAAACHRPSAISVSTNVPERVYHDSDYVLLTAEDLSDRPGFFHNKPVKAEGRYVNGFEVSSFHIEITTYRPADSSKTFYEWSRAIWLSGIKTTNKRPDDGRTYHNISVKGVFDTTGKGHLSKYFATIKNAIIEYK